MSTVYIILFFVCNIIFYTFYGPGGYFDFDYFFNGVHQKGAVHIFVELAKVFGLLQVDIIVLFNFYGSLRKKKVLIFSRNDKLFLGHILILLGILHGLCTMLLGLDRPFSHIFSGVLVYVFICLNYCQVKYNIFMWVNHGILAFLTGIIMFFHFIIVENWLEVRPFGQIQIILLVVSLFLNILFMSRRGECHVWNFSE